MKNYMEKIKCKCGRDAIWSYIPNGSFYCDNCVPRGCICNLKSITEFPNSENGITPTRYYNIDDTKAYIMSEISDEEFEKRGSLERKEDSSYYEVLDDLGRREPCCEYDYSYDGFKIEE